MSNMSGHIIMQIERALNNSRIKREFMFVLAKLDIPCPMFWGICEEDDG